MNGLEKGRTARRMSPRSMPAGCRLPRDAEQRPRKDDRKSVPTAERQMRTGKGPLLHDFSVPRLRAFDRPRSRSHAVTLTLSAALNRRFDSSILSFRRLASHATKARQHYSLVKPLPQMRQLR